MPSNFQPRRGLVRPGVVWGLACLAVLAVSLPAMAEGTETEAGGETATTPRTATVNGVTVTWDLDSRRFRSPSAAEAARIAEEFNRMMAERFAHGKGALAPAGGEAEVRTLPSGAKAARLPVHLLNASLVRVEADGRPRNLCVDSPVQAGTALNAPAALPVEEK